jgi:simple sugar transport system permease protein
LGGALAGALFGSIPGILKTSTGAHEVITTIMLNYVAINITDFLSNGPWKEVSYSDIVARTPPIEESAAIPRVAGLPVGFFIAILFAILIWWILEKTTLGFEIRTAGLSGTAAKYAGIKVTAIIIITMVISGALAGIGGAVETQGIVGRYQPGFNTGLGFDGITVALLGKVNPIGNIFSALLIGAMKAGGAKMQFVAGVTPEITNVVQALMLFFVAAERVVRWIIRQRDVVEEGPALTSGWGN